MRILRNSNVPDRFETRSVLRQCSGLTSFAKYINVALLSYMRAFGNGPRDFEPWSSNRTLELAPSSPNYHTNGRVFELSTDLTCISHLHGGSLAVLGTNL
ncbi:hypothetical protein TNCV_1962271 [Trichonephila clavipes]|nr:hypothetical protein TNCV_1962271 [Trichonephila clavipes]